MVGASPKQKGESGSIICAMAAKPRSIHSAIQATVSSWLWPIAFSLAITRRLFTGWMSVATARAAALTRARITGSRGNSDGDGWLSSRNSRIAIDCVSTVPSSSTSVGTPSPGLIEA